MTKTHCWMILFSLVILSRRGQKESNQCIMVSVVIMTELKIFLIAIGVSGL